MQAHQMKSFLRKMHEAIDAGGKHEYVAGRLRVVFEWGGKAVAAVYNPRRRTLITVYEYDPERNPIRPGVNRYGRHRRRR